jgi:DnaJ-class molecular chaperone
MFEKYYKILELQPNASKEDIKRAYKKLAMKYHPDKNQDDKDKAENKFKEISEAYEILSNPEKYRNNINMNGMTRDSINPHDIFNQLFRGMDLGNFVNMNDEFINVTRMAGHPNVRHTTTFHAQNGRTVQTTFQRNNGGQVRQTIIINGQQINL